MVSLGMSGADVFCERKVRAVSVCAPKGSSISDEKLARSHLSIAGCVVTGSLGSMEPKYSPDSHDLSTDHRIRLHIRVLQPAVYSGPVAKIVTGAEPGRNPAGLYPFGKIIAMETVIGQLWTACLELVSTLFSSTSGSSLIAS